MNPESRVRTLSFARSPTRRLRLCGKHFTTALEHCLWTQSSLCHSPLVNHKFCDRRQPLTLASADVSRGGLARGRIPGHHCLLSRPLLPKQQAHRLPHVLHHPHWLQIGLPWPRLQLPKQVLRNHSQIPTSLLPAARPITSSPQSQEHRHRLSPQHRPCRQFHHPLPQWLGLQMGGGCGLLPELPRELLGCRCPNEKMLGRHHFFVAESCIASLLSSRTALTFPMLLRWTKQQSMGEPEIRASREAMRRWVLSISPFTTLRIRSKRLISQVPIAFAALAALPLHALPEFLYLRWTKILASNHQLMTHHHQHHRLPDQRQLAAFIACPRSTWRRPASSLHSHLQRRENCCQHFPSPSIGPRMLQTTCSLGTSPPPNHSGVLSVLYSEGSQAIHLEEHCSLGQAWKQDVGFCYVFVFGGGRSRCMTAPIVRCFVFSALCWHCNMYRSRWRSGWTRNLFFRVGHFGHTAARAALHLTVYPLAICAGANATLCPLREMHVFSDQCLWHLCARSSQVGC